MVSMVLGGLIFKSKEPAYLVLQATPKRLATTTLLVRPIVKQQFQIRLLYTFQSINVAAKSNEMT